MDAMWTIFPNGNSQIMNRCPRTFCVIGPIQAHGGASHREPQLYRNQISKIVTSVFPNSLQYEPDRGVQELTKQITRSLDNGIPTKPELIRAISREFLEATEKVGHCDLVVGYLPPGILSLGTAMELYSAHLGDAHTVLISENIENLALLSTVKKFLPDIGSLSSYLTEYFKP